MIRLDLKRDQYWLDLLPEVRLKVRPATTALIMAARSTALKGEAADRQLTLIKRLAVLAVVDWDGVGDENGEPTQVSEAGVEALMDLWPVAQAFESDYLAPALLLDTEKNG